MAGCTSLTPGIATPLLPRLRHSCGAGCLSARIQFRRRPSLSVFSYKTFGLWATRGKKKYQRKCNAPWPCTCEQDFSKPCPYRWILQKSGKCKKPRFGKNSGDCVDKVIDLSKATFRRKWEVAYRCRVTWPCGGHRGILPDDATWQTLAARRDPAVTEQF